MKKLTLSLYGIFAYLIGLSGLSAFILFIGGWNFLPLHINSNIADKNSMMAIMINVLIIVLFGLHHSITSRKSFKKKLAEYIPEKIERSTYVLVSGIFMIAICLFWQPLAGTLWNIENTIVIILLKTFSIVGWLVLSVATFEIDHFHLMGLKQSFTIDAGDETKLKESFLYSVVRHPIQTGLLIGIWSTAYMSMTQFMLTVSLTIYVFIGLHFEEKSLETHFGDTYLDYKKRVPGVIPFWPTKSA